MTRRRLDPHLIGLINATILGVLSWATIATIVVLLVTRVAWGWPAW